MNIFNLYCDVARFKVLCFVDGADIDMLRAHQYCAPFGTLWKPIKQMHIPKDDEGYDPNALDGDFISIGTRIALTPKAISKAADLFKPWGELLPVTVVDDNSTVYWFNCTTVVDCIDDTHSNFLLGDFAFIPSRMTDAEVFQARSQGAGLFCTDSFKQRLEATGLTGLIFTLRWSDEPENIKLLKDKKLRNMIPGSILNH